MPGVSLPPEKPAPCGIEKERPQLSIPCRVDGRLSNPEDFMTVRNFSTPVPIFVGLGFPYDIGNAWQACEMLAEWSGARGPAHAMASARCREANAGVGDVEAARLALEAFARKAGILAPDALESAAAEAAKDWLSA